MKSVEETLERLTEDCLDSFTRCGTNLNLVRNHIIYYKREIQELCETEGIFKPDVFYRELPPEVDDNYMAKSEQIRRDAVSVLSRLIESDEYKKLNGSGNHITETNSSKYGVLSYVSRLRTAIEHDDLLTMRRYSYEF